MLMDSTSDTTPWHIYLVNFTLELRGSNVSKVTWGYVRQQQSDIMRIRKATTNVILQISRTTTIVILEIRIKHNCN